VTSELLMLKKELFSPSQHRNLKKDKKEKQKMKLLFIHMEMN